jgi:hypothetical protein
MNGSSIGLFRKQALGRSDHVGHAWANHLQPAFYCGFATNLLVKRSNFGPFCIVEQWKGARTGNVGFRELTGRPHIQQKRSFLSGS